MRTLTECFEGTPIRAAWDSVDKKWWFSAVDVCRAIKGCSYKTARTYWKWLRLKFVAEEHQLARISNQLKYLAADGKYYYTTAMDTAEVMLLILSFPDKSAVPLKSWLASRLAHDAEVTAQMLTVGKNARGKPVDPLLQTTVRVKITE